MINSLENVASVKLTNIGIVISVIVGEIVGIDVVGVKVVGDNVSVDSIPKFVQYAECDNNDSPLSDNGAVLIIDYD